MGFAGQVAVVTGASSGIGRALALELAARGCRVGLLARRRELLEQVRDEVRGRGGVAEVAVADIARREEALAAIRGLSGALGPADLLVANAGAGVTDRLEPMNIPEQEAAVRVNFFGVMYAIEAVLPEMLRRRRGRLVAISSLCAYKGLPGSAAYCASKAAVNVYMEGLRIQLRKKGVAVTTVCPGFVDTPMVANNPKNMPLLMRPEEAARRIVRAIRRGKKVYNFPWATTRLVRLARWAPDWLVARLLVGMEDPENPS